MSDLHKQAAEHLLQAQALLERRANEYDSTLHPVLPDPDKVVLAQAHALIAIGLMLQLDEEKP